MTQGAAEILLVEDSSRNSGDIIGCLNPSFGLRRVFTEQLAGVEPGLRLPYVLNVDLAKLPGKPEIESLIGRYDGAKIFILDDCSRRDFIKVHDLGATDYFVRPLSEIELAPAIIRALNRNAETAWRSLNSTQRGALRVSVKCFEDCFSRAAGDEALPAEDLKSTSAKILQATAGEDLDTWMAALRNHHSYTFRHSMFVCGTISAFSHAIGIRGIDLELLVQGALLHDIGKAGIPLHVLDKPRALDDAEWKVMRRHPEISRRYLLQQDHLDPQIVAMAAHHHERLDGRGYPDGLKGSEINDYVRLVAIGDVFSALVDKRSYKAALPKEEAIKIMMRAQDHLDMDLVSTFRDFILSS
ncbi:MAG: HD domain-containing phosphohydrolase [Pseudomonadota bacterium]